MVDRHAGHAVIESKSGLGLVFIPAGPASTTAARSRVRCDAQFGNMVAETLLAAPYSLEADNQRAAVLRAIRSLVQIELSVLVPVVRDILVYVSGVMEVGRFHCFGEAKHRRGWARRGPRQKCKGGHSNERDHPQARQGSKVAVPTRRLVDRRRVTTAAALERFALHHPAKPACGKILI